MTYIHKQIIFLCFINENLIHSLKCEQEWMNKCDSMQYDQINSHDVKIAIPFQPLKTVK